MARPLRIVYADAFYHVAARGNEKKSIFKSDKDYGRFLLYVEAAVERYGAVIHAYCLMDNHYHLLLQTPRANLPEIMQYINGSYTTYVNTKRQRAGHLFQGRYKGIVIEADAYAQELSRYIHLNPVRAGVVQNPEGYPWSSYQFYCGKKNAPKWLSTKFILDYFDARTRVAQMKYRQFVQEKPGQRYENPLKGVVASSILGGQEFIRKVKKSYVQHLTYDRNTPGLTALMQRPVAEIMDVVIREFKGMARMQKAVGIYVCHRYSGLRLREIGEYFGIGESGVTQASKRFRVEVENDKKLAVKIETIRTKLGLSNV